MSRAALVTGAARRIGAVIAIELAKSGFDVAIHYGRSREEAERTAEAVRALGRRAAVLDADLGREAEVERLVGRAVEALGPLELLVNNASVFLDDGWDSGDRALWDAHMEVNLRAPLTLARAFAGQARAGASIVNIIDQRVLKPTPQFFSYSISKAALWFATRTLAQALAPKVRVNAVGPGPTLASIHQGPEDFAAEAAGVLLQRCSTPEEIARAVLYLVDAPSVTGQMIAVDAGQHLGWRTPDVLCRPEEA
jgi:NAD(P)-dependent dehydrogenase (short-subunit alcohol dehydrogenase family)